MALINCNECGKEISDKAVSCPNCGAPNEKIEVLTESCEYCGEENKIGLDYCDYCNMRLTDYNRGTSITTGSKRTEDIFVNYIQKDDITFQKAQLSLQSMNLINQQEQLQLQREQMGSMARCPKCGSTSLSGDKKGFGVGKAVIGAWALGPIGLVAGNIGSKKVNITCLKCGKRFKT